MDRIDQYKLIMIGILLERYGGMDKEDPQDLTDIENYILNTFDVEVYDGQLINTVYNNILNKT